jgi:hypothetical protein
LAEWNRSAESRNRRHLLVRHGGRTLLPINYGEVSQQWRLHCDITSLLLEHELGVLEKIERLFKPLRISRHPVTALIAQRDKLKPHQKSQLDEAESLLEMLVKGKFRVPDRELFDASIARLWSLPEGAAFQRALAIDCYRCGLYLDAIVYALRSVLIAPDDVLKHLCSWPFLSGRKNV